MALTLRNGQINITNPLKVSELFPNIGDWNIEKIFHMSELKLHRSFFTKSTLFCWMERTTITIFVRWWILDPWWPRQSMNNPIIVLLSLRSGVSVLRPSQLERDETSSPQLYYASPLTFILGDCITVHGGGETPSKNTRHLVGGARHSLTDDCLLAPARAGSRRHSS